MLKQVIWIDQTKFICKLAEGLLAEHGVSCYTLDRADDFSYIISDLEPDLIICDLKTVSVNLDKFKEQVSDFEGKILTTATIADYEQFKDFPFAGCIEKPIEVEKLFNLVSEFVK